MGMYVSTRGAAVHCMLTARRRLAAVCLGGMGLPLHVTAWYVATASWEVQAPRQCDEVGGSMVMVACMCYGATADPCGMMQMCGAPAAGHCAGMGGAVQCPDPPPSLLLLPAHGV